jgi:hypothetical protein
MEDSVMCPNCSRPVELSDGIWVHVYNGSAYPCYPAPPTFCKKDWQMHSCALLYGHDGDHVCPCGDRRPNV